MKIWATILVLFVFYLLYIRNPSMGFVWIIGFLIFQYLASTNYRAKQEYYVKTQKSLNSIACALNSIHLTMDALHTILDRVVQDQSVDKLLMNPGTGDPRTPVLADTDEFDHILS